ncbi:flagellin [Janthinobacterium sp. GW460W]|uniref:flagellin N-terminal helical domain-containing protein n=1 Tax=Janthinobacterium sp. GW460W TaxID=1981502 RepID=UPI00345E62FC
MSNTQNSTSMLQTAEGAFGEVTNMLVRMKDLATQAADASSNTADKDAMQAEYDALGLELSNVMNNTTFGGQALLTGGTIAGAMTFQIGAAKSETMTINLTTSMGSVATALGSATANFAGTAGGTELKTLANTAIGSLISAIDSIGVVRSALGAAANRLDHVNSNLSNISTNTKAARPSTASAWYVRHWAPPPTASTTSTATCRTSRPTPRPLPAASWTLTSPPKART